MNGTGKGESERASREARDAVVSRPPGSKGRGKNEALRRYLTAETAQELKRLRKDAETHEKPAAGSR
jgi:hypothetical protein